jgi:hypothetical protein
VGGIKKRAHRVVKPAPVALVPPPALARVTDGDGPPEIIIDSSS